METLERSKETKPTLFFFFFKGTSILSSIVVVPIYIHTNSVEGFLFLHTLPSMYFVCLFCFYLFRAAPTAYGVPRLGVELEL